MCNKCTETKYDGVIYGLHNGDGVVRYIGRTEHYRTRFIQHRRRAETGRTNVYQWMRDEGVENIHLIILETFTKDQFELMPEREYYYIEEARESNPGTLLNQHRATLKPLSPEGRANKSKASLGNNNVRSGEDHYRYGQTVSDEVRARMSASMMGRAGSVLIYNGTSIAGWLRMTASTARRIRNDCTTYS